MQKNVFRLLTHHALWTINLVLITLSLFPQGFDEYMNLVLDDAEEVNVKKKSRKTLGLSFDYYPIPWPKLSWIKDRRKLCFLLFDFR